MIDRESLKIEVERIILERVGTYEGPYIYHGDRINRGRLLNRLQAGETKARKKESKKVTKKHLQATRFSSPFFFL
ncbi:hypothetical protein WN55_10256 [Dufourea novaeangliae]|uniref:Uncharacterized protein n=1 Tax=Dufourea novaeangliae TaxID=178035 RepID=A0A154P352_DUFNO|nr:hypothetical protein WN55_10256 [Dufourea novaeangliae]